MKKLRVALKKSRIGLTEKRSRHLDGLGLYKPADIKILENTPAVRGMVKKVLDMVKVEEIEVEE
jgi:large subunit ribosomal protein L30